MMTRRRSLLKQAGLAAGLGMLELGWPRRVLSQGADAALVSRLERDMQTHASFGLKFAGGPGDHATADWTAERLRAVGFGVTVSEFDAPYFEQRAARLRLAESVIEVVPQAPVAVTSPNGLSARLAVIDDDGIVGDVRGRIAVIVAPFARHAALFRDRGIGATVVAAVEAGAAAIVIVTTGPSRDAVALNCPDQGPFVPVPVAVLAPKRAEAVIDEARAGGLATLVIDGEATRKPCKNVIGILERGPQWIAMSTPRSGWYHCVAERGTGQAAFLEIAAWLARRFPQHSIFLMNTGAHEYFFAGSHFALEAAPPPDRTVAWAHIGATLAARDARQIDGGWQMLDTVDPSRRTMATAKARSAVIESFAGLVGLDDPGIVQPQAGELSSFTDRGFDTAFACIGQHRWFHTLEDTIDCVDARLLLPVVRAHEATLERLIEA
jgi:hypothetical protein